MPTKRWGSVVSFIIWLSGWGLIWIHGAFFLPMFAMTMAVVAVAGISRLKADDGEELVFIKWPLFRWEVRHNRRARLRRRIERLRQTRQVCEELIKEEDETRIPILEAERDAAGREIKRLNDDIRLMEAMWVKEDRERTYRKLTA